MPVLDGRHREGSTTVSLHIEIDNGKISAFCRLHAVRRLSFFGSVTRDDFTPESDVDVVVEFVENVHVGLFEFVDMQEELTGIIGRNVDLHTPASLSHYFRDAVLSSAEVAYAA
jgi:predicted nucleotidyltransferase